MSNHKEYLFKFLMALSVLGLLVGSWGVFQIMAYGKNATALGSYVTWGLWVAVYLFFPGSHGRRFSHYHPDLCVQGKDFCPGGAAFGFHGSGGSHVRGDHHQF